MFYKSKPLTFINTGNSKRVYGVGEVTKGISKLTRCESIPFIVGTDEISIGVKYPVFLGGNMTIITLEMVVLSLFRALKLLTTLVCVGASFS